MDNREHRLDPLEDIVGDLFVDRDEELTLFWEWATSIPHRLGNSYALIGRRRTGKTAILVKLFNRLFQEQAAVLPVFISFARYQHLRRPLTMEEVGDHYLSAYIGCFLAFRYRRPELLRLDLSMARIRTLASEFNDPIVDELIGDYDVSAQTPNIGDPVAQMAINTPRAVAGIYNIPAAVIVDEFQVLTEVHDPKQGVSHDLTDSFQWAVDTRLAPMLVSGSAVSLLVGQALGGLLSGRFNYWYLEPLAREYAHDLVFRIGEAGGMTVTEELAEAVWELTSGYPYSIHSLMTSLCPARQRYPSLDALEEVLTFELSDHHGKLWQHYDEEFNKYSELLNTSQVTKKVMFWATKYPEKQIDAERVASEIGVGVDDVQAALRNLHKADIVDKVGWTLYRGPGDPMLRRYIEYNYRREIERLAPAEAVKDWQKEYQRLRGRMSNFIGEVAEVYVNAVMSAFDGREVEGQAYFNHPDPVTLPAFDKVERRGGIVKAGIPIEIDLTGEWALPDEEGVCAWLVQVKYTHAPIGEDDIRRFLSQTDAVIADKGYQVVIRWYFCKQGYTDGVARALQDAGILFSDRAQFNAVANLFGFFGLPR